MLHECVQICQRKRKSRLYQLLIFFCFLASILFFVHIPIGESSISRRIRQSSKAAARLFHHLIDSKTPHLGNFQLYIDSKRTIHNGLALRELFERTISRLQSECLIVDIGVPDDGILLKMAKSWNHRVAAFPLYPSETPKYISSMDIWKPSTKNLTLTSIHQFPKFSVDSFVKPQWILLLRISVDGYESEAMQSASQLLNKGTVTYIVLHIDPLKSKQRNTDARRAINQLLKLTYKVMLLTSSKLLNRFSPNSRITNRNLDAFLYELEVHQAQVYVFATQGLDLAIPDYQPYTYYTQQDPNIAQSERYWYPTKCPKVHSYAILENGNLQLGCNPVKYKGMLSQRTLPLVAVHATFQSTRDSDHQDYPVENPNGIHVKHESICATIYCTPKDPNIKIEDILELDANSEHPEWIHDDPKFGKVLSSISCAVQNVPKDYLQNRILKQSNSNSNFLLIMIDALSQKVFEREMPKTHNWIQSHSHTPGVWFNKPSIVGANSGPNQAALFSGALPKGRDLGTVTRPWLWDVLKSIGYVTMKLEGGCIENSNMIQSLDPMMDHTMPNFFCFDAFSRPNCLSSIPIPEYIVDYTKKFMENYKNVRWAAFLNFLEAHEDTSLLVRHLDSPILRLLKEIEKNHAEDTIVLLLSDHGLHYGPRFQSTSGKREHRQPLAYFHLSNRLVHALGADAIDTLQANRDTTITPFDLHETLIDWLKIRHVYPTVSPNDPERFSLSQDFLPYPRDCDKSGIPKEFCPAKQKIVKKCSPIPQFPSVLGYYSDATTSVTSHSNPKWECGTDAPDFTYMDSQGSVYPNKTMCNEITFYVHRNIPEKELRNKDLFTKIATALEPLPSSLNAPVTIGSEKNGEWGIFFCQSALNPNGRKLQLIPHKENNINVHARPQTRQQVIERVENTLLNWCNQHYVNFEEVKIDSDVLFMSSGSTFIRQASRNIALTISGLPHVWLIQVDATSRRQATRFLPRTLSLLDALSHDSPTQRPPGPPSNKALRKDYRAFDFERFAAIGQYSLSVQIPMYTGCIFVKASNSRRKVHLADGSTAYVHYPHGTITNDGIQGYELHCPEKSERQGLSPDEYGSPWIFDIFRRAGYVTMMGEEFCADDSKWAISYNYFHPQTRFDHYYGGLFCDPDHGNRWSGLSNNCVGNKYRHDIMFNYMSRFRVAYPGLPHFSVVDFSTNHEYTSPSQDRILTIDNSLTKFIQEILESPQGENSLILLVSDHGMHGGWYLPYLAGQQEHSQPWFQLVLPVKLAEFIAGETKESTTSVLDRLASNRHRLVTVFDIYATLTDLIPSSVRGHIEKNELHESPTKDKKSPKYISPTVEITKAPYMFDLILDDVPDDRTCEQAQITKDLSCPCEEQEVLDT